MNGLKPYDRVEDYGVPWLGRVPEHWGVRNLGSMTTSVSERGRPDLPLLSVVREKGVIRRATMSDDENHNFVPDDLSNYKVVRTGDLVINKMKAWQGSLGMAPCDGIVSPAYYVFRFDIENQQFGQRLLRSRPYVWFLAQASDGVRIGQWDLSISGMKRIPVLVPPPDEQAAIVRFLDHLDRQIGRHVRSKQHLIRLLEEQKRSIIHDAVTLGCRCPGRLQALDSVPPFEVNAEWPIVRLGAVSRYRSEKNRPDSQLLSVFLGRGVIPYGEGGGQVHKPSLDLAGYQVVHPGDLVLNNQQAWRGSVGVSQHHGIISPAYVVMALSPAFDAGFSDYLFQSRVMVSQFLTASKGVGDIQRDIHTPWLKNVRVPLPPLDEQRRIARMLSEWTGETTRRVAGIQRELELLRELRTRLVADVVTGQVDVREAAASLPELPDDESSVDLEPEAGGDATLAEDTADSERPADE